MVDYEIIGERIRTSRKQRKLTQENLAECCNLTVEYISKIENGKAKPTIDTLGMICEAIDCDMGFLFSGVSIDSKHYKLDEICRLFQNCKPEIKPIALDLIRKLSNLE